MVSDDCSQVVVTDISVVTLKKGVKYIRNPDRLDSFYAELKEIHKYSFPDMRFGQFMMNALGWINSTKKRDPFFQKKTRCLI